MVPMQVRILPSTPFFNTHRKTYMKKIAAIALLMTATAAFAYGSSENPHQVFSIKRVHSNEITVNIIASDNVQKTCNAESNKRGYSNFKYSVEACSFWSESKRGNQCTIVLPTNTNFHTIGHEFRHCLQGDFHK